VDEMVRLEVWRYMLEVEAGLVCAVERI
jgi:hypothetical protein